MPAQPSLELALFRKQKAVISRMLETPSKAFRLYEARYRRRTRRYETALSSEQVLQEARSADVIYVGDYHTLRTAQEAFLQLARAATTWGRRVVFALELVEGRYQTVLDAYLARELPEELFLQQLGIRSDAVSIWSGFRPLLAFAREQRLQTIAIDRRAQGPRSLTIRDAYAARKVAAAASAPDRPLVLVLMGQYHIAPCHLPAAVTAELEDPSLRQLVVYQNCEDLYWRASREAPGAAAVRIRDGELCLINTSPVLAQQSFLDHVEADSGDALLPPSALAPAFGRVARLIARQLGVDLQDQVDTVAVCSVADPDVLERLQARARFTPQELRQLRQRLLDRDSCYIPRARLVYLASLSLSHAAEEAAHFVRHLCVGPGMDRERSRKEAFYARCLEEALGFVGSRLVHPDRPAPRHADLADSFRHGRGQAKSVAAYVLAHRAAQDGTQVAREKLIPSEPKVFDGVSHTLGYLLGDALDLALREGRLRRTELRALFNDPFDAAEDDYFALLDRVKVASPKKRARR